MNIIKNELLQETIFHEKLDNHMDVFFMEKKGFNKKYAVMATNYGSNDLRWISPHTGREIAVHEGIAHFLEHKMFEQPDGGNAFDKFASIGASANAYTNFNMTAYLFSATENFEEGLRHLISYVQTPHFTKENVEKEKGIIAQEIKMYDDNPDWCSFFNTLKAMYVNHPNRIDIAGTVESIYEITAEELYDCYNSFYSPSNMALFVVGDLDQEQIMQIVKETVSDKNMFEGSITRLQEEEPDHVAQSVLTSEMDVSVPMFSIGFKEKSSAFSQGVMAREITTELLLDMLFRKGSPLYEKLYMEGLVFGGMSSDYTAHTDYGYTILSGESRNIEEVQKQIRAALAEAKTKGLNQEAFEIAKKKKIGSFIRSFDSIESIANGYLSYHFRGVDILDYYDELGKVGLEDLQRRLEEHFDESMSVLTVIEPKSDVKTGAAVQ